MSLILNKNIAAGEVVQDAINNGELLKAPSQNIVFDQLALKADLSLVGAVSGIASLDGSGKIPASQLTATAFEYLGLYNATTDSPALADGTGSAGDLYHVSVAGTQDFGAGNITFSVGDKVVYNGSVWEKWDLTESVSSVNSQTGAVVLDSDDISEGSTNLYYTAARFNSAFAAKSTSDLSEGTNLYYTAARFNTAFSGKSTSDLSEGSNLYFTDARAIAAPITGYVSGAGVVAATDSILQAIQKLNGNIGAAAPINDKESFVLSAGDITNKYVDLLQVVKVKSVDLMFSGLIHEEGVSYSVSLTGGAGGKTRISFIGDLEPGVGASALVASDRIVIKYLY